MRSFAILLLTSAALSAQQASISGPVSGYVFDQSARALRPVLGFPGASLFGDPLGFDFDVSSAIVAPRLDTVFAVGTDGASHIFRLSGGTLAERSVDGLAASPDHVVFSPSGNAVALSAGGSIEVIKGLPDAPAIAGGVDLTPGTVLDSLAVSDDGSVLLVSTGNTVRLYGSSSDMGKLMDTAGSALLAFAPGSHDAAVTDASGAGLVLYRDLTGSGASQVIATPDDTIKGASAVTFSNDGKNLLLASGTAQSVTAFDLTAGARNAIACSCAPQSLARMGSLFRLNDFSSDPLWLLDTTPDQPRIVFVPALAQATASVTVPAQ
jgi:WD40 repeat protein